MQTSHPSLRAKQPEIGKLIRHLRQEMELTQEKLAARLGVTFPTLNRWENGRATPSPLAMEKIEALLHQIGDRGQLLLSQCFSETE
ncbi:MAG: helix-turn-helix domain-containing protein [Timaviella obliquedivisa GSE-PSE-MK23-08B]|jgi:transcriptional regulator with XRE-family HTH domain|nr:helix-turn-helix domain-containing protein [Timaviella obliquedivisa GSE-PSE-MK23-08B]